MHTDRQTDRQTYIVHTDRHTDRQADIHTYGRVSVLERVPTPGRRAVPGRSGKVKRASAFASIR